MTTSPLLRITDTASTSAGFGGILALVIVPSSLSSPWFKLAWYQVLTASPSVKVLGKTYKFPQLAVG